MFLQVPQDAEHLATSGAPEGLLSSVEPKVCLQIVPQPEAFVATGADVRPLPRVKPHMAAEALPQCKSL